MRGIMRRLKVLLFAAIVLGQAAVIGAMLSGVASIRSEGVVIRLRCEAVDPYDPMRGRFVIVSPGLRTVPASDMPSIADLPPETLRELAGGGLYAVFDPAPGREESLITDLSTEKPRSGEVWLRPDAVRIGGEGDDASIEIRLPSFRYYLQEDFAPAADALLRDRERVQRLRPTLLLEIDRDGEYLVSGILIGDLPIEEYLKGQR